MYWSSSDSKSCVFILLIVFVSFSLASSKFDFPLGVSFGVNEVTSGYLSEKDEFVPVTSVQTSQAWKNLARHLDEVGSHYIRERDVYSESDVERILTTELSSIQTASKAKLNQDIEILGLAAPSFFEHASGQIFIDITARIQPDIIGLPIFSWPYLHIIRMGLQLNTAESLEYPIGTNIDEEDCHLVHFDYQSNSLKASITSIGTDVTNQISQFRIQDFGGEGQNASLEKLEDVATRTRKLIHAEISKPYEPPQLSDFRRIILSGDAPASEFQKIRDHITKVIPEFADRFVEGVEPRWVGALGAARLAKLLKLEPERWEEINPYVVKDSYTLSHDDL